MDANEVLEGLRGLRFEAQSASDDSQAVAAVGLWLEAYKLGIENVFWASAKQETWRSDAAPNVAGLFEASDRARSLALLDLASKTANPQEPEAFGAEGVYRALCYGLTAAQVERAIEVKARIAGCAKKFFEGGPVDLLFERFEQLFGPRGELGSGTTSFHSDTEYRPLNVAIVWGLCKVWHAVLNRREKKIIYRIGTSKEATMHPCPTQLAVFLVSAERQKAQAARQKVDVARAALDAAVRQLDEVVTPFPLQCPFE